MKQQIVQGTQIQEQYSCCDGKIFFINDKKQVIITFFLTTAILTLHYCFHVSWFSTRHYFIPLYILFISHFVNFWAFLVILTSNPGIIQKIAYQYQNDMNYVQLPKNQLSRSHIQISNIMTVNSNVSKIKLCSTCNIYRPPRAHHCSQCGVCIQRMDHHCPWLGVCIGKYNYKYFYIYLLSLIITIIDIVAMCIGMMAQQKAVTPLAIILVLLNFPAFIFVGLMLFFHTYLSCINLTTKQYLDQFWTQIAGNPNRKSFFIKNCLKTFFVKSQREIKYKYVQYFVKSEGQSSSQHKVSSSENNQHNNSISRISQGQKKSSNSNSNSDENNISKQKKDKNERKSQKIKSEEKQNSLDNKNQNQKNNDFKRQNQRNNENNSNSAMNEEPKQKKSSYRKQILGQNLNTKKDEILTNDKNS